MNILSGGCPKSFEEQLITKDVCFTDDVCNNGLLGLPGGAV